MDGVTYANVTVRVPAAAAFVDDIGRVADYLVADDIYALTRDLINVHDTQLAPAVGVRLAVLWKREGGQTGGVLTLADCVRPSALVRFYSHAQMLIWLAADHLAGQSPAVVEAVLFHQLCHIGRDDKNRPVRRPHDFDGFHAELTAYGAWRADLAVMVDAAQQLSLPLTGVAD